MALGPIFIAFVALENGGNLLLFHGYHEAPPELATRLVVGKLGGDLKQIQEVLKQIQEVLRQCWEYIGYIIHRITGDAS